MQRIGFIVLPGFQMLSVAALSVFELTVLVVPDALSSAAPIPCGAAPSVWVAATATSPVPSASAAANSAADRGVRRRSMAPRVSAASGWPEQRRNRHGRPGREPPARAEGIAVAEHGPEGDHGDLGLQRPLGQVEEGLAHLLAAMEHQHGGARGQLGHDQATRRHQHEAQHQPV